MTTLELTLERGEELSVRRFEAHERAGAPFSLIVLARSPDPSVDIDTIVGRGAALRAAGDGPAGRRGWRGVVARMEQVAVEPLGLSTYELLVVPELWLLGKRTNHRVFQHLSVRGIVGAVLGEWGLVGEWDIDDGLHPPFEYRVQYGESDLAFVSRMLEESGITLLFPEADDGHVGARIRLSDRPGHAEPRTAPLRWVERPGPSDHGDVAHTLRFTREVRPGALVVRDHDFMNPAHALEGSSRSGDGGGTAVEARLEQHEYRPGAFLVESETGAGHDAGYGGRVAERGNAAARAGHRVLAFGATAMDVGPGVVLSVGGHPHPEVEGARRFLVTELAASGGAVGEPWVTSVRAVPAEIAYHPPRTTPRPKVHGVQSATVVGPGEIHTDASGRVRVQFPWDRAARTGDTSCWIRPAQGWSGAGYGAFALPRVGQEVLVAFLEGDPDRPVIVGRLHNETSPVPYGLPARKTESGYRSASSPGGGGQNEIRLDDASTEELFSHQAERDQRVLVKHDETSTIVQDRAVTVAENHFAETVGRRVQHTVGRRIEETALARVESIGGASSRTVGGDDDHRVLGSHLVSVVEDVDAVIVQTKREQVRSHEDRTVKGGDAEAVGGGAGISAASLQVSADKIAIHTDGDLHLMAGSIVLEGADATAKGTGGFVHCSAAGVEIEGALVKINAGGSPASGGDVSPAKAELPVSPEAPAPLGFGSFHEIVRMESEGSLAVVVGEKVTLELRVDGKPVQPGTWVIDGPHVKSYEPDGPLSVPLRGKDFEASRIAIHFLVKGDFEVRAQSRIGATLATIIVNVTAPSVIFAFGVTSKMAVHSFHGADWFQFGEPYDPGHHADHPAPGIRFHYQVSANNLKIGGEIAGIQLVKPGRRWIENGTLVETTRNPEASTPVAGLNDDYDPEFSLDETAPYTDATPLPAGGIATWLIGPGDGHERGFPPGDSPGIPLLPGRTLAHLDDSFKMFLMFRAETAESIWVTLKLLVWHAGGTAGQVPGFGSQWFVTNDTSSSSPVIASDWSLLPAWTTRCSADYTNP